MTLSNIVALLLVGALLGFAIGWLFGRGRVITVSSDAGLVAELRDRLATERQQLETIQQKCSDAFTAISNELLVQNANWFNQQSGENLAQLLAPLKDTLGAFKESLDKTHDSTTANSALLKDQVSRIGAEAANLSKALKGDVKVLGNWGENMLDQILEKSGLQGGMHYRRQRGAKDAEGDQRFLDVIVDLPDKRNLVIDSKVSLRAYEESINAPDDETRLAALDRHAKALRQHFRDLGSKRYQDIHSINAPDFVLMYVPIETAFFAGVTCVPQLFAEALDHNVVLITNSTLLATLRTVAHVWGLADQQKNAQEIARRGGLLYDKFVGFVDDMQEVDKSLKAGQSAWDEAWKKLKSGKGNLVSQADQLKKLGAKGSKSSKSMSLDFCDEAAESDSEQATD
jgi:DNA recombination protein RmuC